VAQDVRRRIGLRKEPTAGRKALPSADRLPRRHQETDGRPAISDQLGELQAVERARHLDVGEQQIDVAAFFKRLQSRAVPSATMTA